jgi:hypothetical protein
MAPGAGASNCKGRYGWSPTGRMPVEQTTRRQTQWLLTVRAGPDGLSARPEPVVFSVFAAIAPSGVAIALQADKKNDHDEKRKDSRVREADQSRTGMHGDQRIHRRS